MDRMTDYQSWEHDKIEDISRDTDAILKMVGGKEKMESYDSGLLAGMLSKQGIDPGVLALLDRDRNNGTLGDNGLVLLFLILLLGGGCGGYGFGRGADGVAGVDRTVVNEANYSRLLDAIGGNREAIAGLAQTLNCDMNAIQNALCGVDKQLAVNQGSIINAIQSCCCNIQNKIQECCCQTNLNIERGFCGVNQNIQGLAYQMQTIDGATRQLIQQSFCDQNAYLADQFCQIKMREDQREIQALRDKVQEQRENANTALILNAIANKDAITFSGTAGATAFNGTGSIS